MSSLKLTAAPLNINGFYNMKFPAILQLVPCFPIFQEVYSPLVFREGYIANVHGVMSMLKAPQLSHCFAYHLEILTVQPLQVLLFFGFPGSLCENQTSKNNIGLKLQSRFFSISPSIYTLSHTFSVPRFLNMTHEAMRIIPWNYPSGFGGWFNAAFPETSMHWSRGASLGCSATQVHQEETSSNLCEVKSECISPTSFYWSHRVFLVKICEKVTHRKNVVSPCFAGWQ